MIRMILVLSFFIAKHNAVFANAFTGLGVQAGMALQGAASGAFEKFQIDESIERSGYDSDETSINSQESLDKFINDNPDIRSARSKAGREIRYHYGATGKDAASDGVHMAFDGEKKWSLYYGDLLIDGNASKMHITDFGNKYHNIYVDEGLSNYSYYSTLTHETSHVYSGTNSDYFNKGWGHKEWMKHTFYTELFYR